MNRVKKFKINTCFVESLSWEDRKAFALVLLIKNRFVSSYIKKYKVSTLACELKTSRHSIKKYIDIILLKEWGVLKDNGDIKIHSTNTIYGDFVDLKKSKRLINVQSSYSIGSVMDELNFIILQRNLDQQEYRARMKRIHLGLKLEDFKTTSSEVRKDKKIVRDNPELLDGELVGRGILGMRRLAEILKCSVNTAISFLKRLQLLGLIKTEHVKRKLGQTIKPSGKNGLTDYVSEHIGHFYRYMGNYYQFVGTSIELHYSKHELLSNTYRNNARLKKNNKFQALFVQFPTLQLSA